MLSYARNPNSTQARIVLSKSLSAAACVAALFGAHSAAAQPVKQQPPPVLTVNQPSLLYCKYYTLTGPEFMGLIKVIVDHGDLTDVSFIEKTMESKFINYDLFENGKKNIQAVEYQTWQTRGAPISDNLDVTVSRERQIKFDSVASMSIESQTLPQLNQDYIRDCLHISMSSFNKFFGGFGVMKNGNPTEWVPDARKSRAKISLSIDYMPDSNLVDDIEINEKP